MKLVSDKYKEELINIHKKYPNKWGTRIFESRWRFLVCHFIVFIKAKTILDFGSGKGTLGKMVCNELRKFKNFRDLNWINYDPGIQAFLNLPKKAVDIVVCLDVLEHVEPELINVTIETIYSLTKHLGIFAISLKESIIDNKNMHLIVEKKEWWLNKFKQYNWSIHELFYKNNNFVMFYTRKG